MMSERSTFGLEYSIAFFTCGATFEFISDLVLMVSMPEIFVSMAVSIYSVPARNLITFLYKAC